LWEEKKYNWWVYLVSVFAVYGTLIVALIFVALILVGFGFSRDSSKMQEVTEILRANKGLMVFTALTAGVMEELTFRGYILSRFELLFRNSGLAIFLSSVLFGLMHFGYGNMFQLAGPFVIGFIFALYYWKFRNIKVVIICHFLWDMMSLAVSTMKH
ncbi:MAG TPA: CPBP family glutamic-type intramembrane protease, partial [Bacteroidia bacterium]|nr:CPBP family glutamic-type intramembrane protease [Bacteroidia bacterium]